MPSRFLLSSGDHSPAPAPPALPDSNIVVILAAMLCGLICVIGLVLVAVCAWVHRRAAAAASAAPPSKGLKRKVIHSLPSFWFDGGKTDDREVAECAICLAEFAEGEEIRLLPQCGHRFHVGCVDTWLGGNSSCPSCRRVLVVPEPSRCSTCGGTPPAAGGGGYLPP